MLMYVLDIFDGGLKPPKPPLEKRIKKQKISVAAICIYLCIYSKTYLKNTQKRKNLKKININHAISNFEIKLLFF